MRVDNLYIPNWSPWYRDNGKGGVNSTALNRDVGKPFEESTIVFEVRQCTRRARSFKCRGREARREARRESLDRLSAEATIVSEVGRRAGKSRSFKCKGYNRL